MLRDFAKEPAPMRTIIYARYSTDMQNVRSVEDQIASCRARCEREGWEIVAIFADRAISGAAGIGHEQRPGLNDLLARVAIGGVDQVLAESTSRMARHRGDAFMIREKINDVGTRLFTLDKGEITEMQEWVSGWVDSQQRKDLAFAIKRGQAGSVRDGRVPAGLAYGYRVANRLDGKGGLIRGLRDIVPAEAAIVRRIFTEYAAELAPRRIAEGLNADAVPGPRGGKWRGSSIAGDRNRANGILQNRLYIGEIVHNRTSKRPDPETRRSLIRPNAEADWYRESAPELRIVDQSLWERVQALRTRHAQLGPQKARRPAHLLSGLTWCGTCGGTFSIITSGYWGCGARREGACDNGRLIGTRTLEDRVLAGLREKMLDPEAVSLWVREYTAEHGRARRQLAGDRIRHQHARDQAAAKISRLVDAIAAGADIEEVRAALAMARAEREAAEQALAEIAASASVIDLHPRLADEYRNFVGGLIDALADPEQRLESVPILRNLISRVVLTPASEGRGCDVLLEGRLSTLLAAAAGRPVDLPLMLVDERVKGGGRKHKFLRAVV